jgi:hypothetical protein
LLFSLPGFRYCDFLLTETEHAAWRAILELETRNSEVENAAALCRSVSERAAKTLKWEEGMRGAPLLDLALHHLILGGAALYAAILARAEKPLRSKARDAQERLPNGSELATARHELDAAVAGLRRAGTQHRFPPVLLTRAWLRIVEGHHTGPESAQADLDEAWEIAERGPMRLFMADIHLYRARLFHGVKPYPWARPQEDLAAARKLIEQCGYWRRKEELEDAEEAARNW